MQEELQVGLTKEEMLEAFQELLQANFEDKTSGDLPLEAILDIQHARSLLGVIHRNNRRIAQDVARLLARDPEAP